MEGMGPRRGQTVGLGGGRSRRTEGKRWHPEIGSRDCRTRDRQWGAPRAPVNSPPCGHCGGWSRGTENVSLSHECALQGAVLWLVTGIVLQRD